MREKCEICRQSCKDSDKDKCKFYPKECFLGIPIHFKEDPTKHYGKHLPSSIMCVVCKEYFLRENIRWVCIDGKYYPECHTDASRQDFIAQNVERHIMA